MDRDTVLKFQGNKYISIKQNYLMQTNSITNS